MKYLPLLFIIWCINAFSLTINLDISFQDSLLVQLFIYLFFLLRYFKNYFSLGKLQTKSSSSQIVKEIQSKFKFNRKVNCFIASDEPRLEYGHIFMENHYFNSKLRNFAIAHELAHSYYNHYLIHIWYPIMILLEISVFPFVLFSKKLGFPLSIGLIIYMLYHYPIGALFYYVPTLLSIFIFNSLIHIFEYEADTKAAKITKDKISAKDFCTNLADADTFILFSTHPQKEKRIKSIEIALS
jgi:hypothetical protein